MEHEGDTNINYHWCFWYSNKRSIKGTGTLRSWQPSEDHPNDNIIENGQNTEKCPGELRGLAVTQTPVRNPRNLNLTTPTNGICTTQHLS